MSSSMKSDWFDAEMPEDDFLFGFPMTSLENTFSANNEGAKNESSDNNGSSNTNHHHHHHHHSANPTGGVGADTLDNSDSIDFNAFNDMYNINPFETTDITSNNTISNGSGSRDTKHSPNTNLSNMILPPFSVKSKKAQGSQDENSLSNVKQEGGENNNETMPCEETSNNGRSGGNVRSRSFTGSMGSQVGSRPTETNIPTVLPMKRAATDISNNNRDHSRTLEMPADYGHESDSDCSGQIIKGKSSGTDCETPDTSDTSYTSSMFSSHSGSGDNGYLNGGCPPIKKRKRLSPDQTQTLIQLFEQVPKPCSELRVRLGKQLGMTAREVQVWFQNRRAKLKRETRVTPFPTMGYSSEQINVHSQQSLAPQSFGFRPKHLHQQSQHNPLSRFSGGTGFLGAGMVGPMLLDGNGGPGSSSGPKQASVLGPRYGTTPQSMMFNEQGIGSPSYLMNGNTPSGESARSSSLSGFSPTTNRNNGMTVNGTNNSATGTNGVTHGLGNIGHMGNSMFSNQSNMSQYPGLQDPFYSNASANGITAHGPGNPMAAAGGGGGGGGPGMSTSSALSPPANLMNGGGSGGGRAPIGGGSGGGGGGWLGIKRPNGSNYSLISTDGRVPGTSSSVAMPNCLQPSSRQMSSVSSGPAMSVDREGNNGMPMRPDQPFSSRLDYIDAFGRAGINITRPPFSNNFMTTSVLPTIPSSGGRQFNNDGNGNNNHSSSSSGSGGGGLVAPKDYSSYKDLAFLYNNTDDKGESSGIPSEEILQARQKNFNHMAFIGGGGGGGGAPNGYNHNGRGNMMGRTLSGIELGGLNSDAMMRASMDENDRLKLFQMKLQSAQQNNKRATFVGFAGHNKSHSISQIPISPIQNEPSQGSNADGAASAKCAEKKNIDFSGLLDNPSINSKSNTPTTSSTANCLNNNKDDDYCGGKNSKDDFFKTLMSLSQNPDNNAFSDILSNSSKGYSEWLDLEFRKNESSSSSSSGGGGGIGTNTIAAESGTPESISPDNQSPRKDSLSLSMLGFNDENDNDNTNIDISKSSSAQKSSSATTTTTTTTTTNSYQGDSKECGQTSNSNSTTPDMARNKDSSYRRDSKALDTPSPIRSQGCLRQLERNSISLGGTKDNSHTNGESCASASDHITTATNTTAKTSQEQLISSLSLDTTTNSLFSSEELMIQLNSSNSKGLENNTSNGLDILLQLSNNNNVGSGQNNPVDDGDDDDDIKNAFEVVGNNNNDEDKKNHHHHHQHLDNFVHIKDEKYATSSDKGSFKSLSPNLHDNSERSLKNPKNIKQEKDDDANKRNDVNSSWYGSKSKSSASHDHDDNNDNQQDPEDCNDENILAAFSNNSLQDLFHLNTSDILSFNDN
ncbi:hypothetical protein H4219_002923 [Mycoemilia scoparia]|uniref:Homeobox domain-containing protein n=1 Tax=Mycoemilia scoparia TaxID=417184 RepID=A0A9W8A1E1_9FUNG|nr:hypothetical protein H4219_002923 [Mycoemilia scoparia]